MRAATALFILLLVPGFAFAAPIKRMSVQEGQFRRWLVHYLSDDPDDQDLQNLVYGYAFTDQNGDASDEAIAWARDANACGTGGCNLDVFVHGRSGWRLLSSTTITRPPIKVLSTRSHGWRDLSARQAGGGIEPPFEAWLRFNGRNHYGIRKIDSVPKDVHGHVIIRDAKIALYASKCRSDEEAPSLGRPILRNREKARSC
jgi:hypothetical protein